jgi:hypothetical protein
MRGVIHELNRLEAVTVLILSMSAATGRWGKDGKSACLDWRRGEIAADDFRPPYRRLRRPIEISVLTKFDLNLLDNGADETLLDFSKAPGVAGETGMAWIM